MTIKPLSVVHSVLYDEVQQKAIGVRVILAQTKETQDYFAKVVFVTAATLNINLILLNSKSKRFPNGLGNDNGLMGKYIAFHNYRATIKAKFEGFPDKTTEGENQRHTMFLGLEMYTAKKQIFCVVMLLDLLLGLLEKQIVKTLVLN